MTSTGSQKHHLLLYTLLLIGAIVISFCGCHRNQQDHTDWPIYLGDKSASHYSTLNQIDTTNVHGLKLAWTYHSGDADTLSHSQIECSPIEIDGILYGTSPRLKLFALDAATGAQRWVFDPFADTTQTPVQINVNRGVSYWGEGDDKRIFFAAGSFLYAINAMTGKPVSTFGDSGRIDLHEGLDRDVQDLYVVSTTPAMIYQNLLIITTRVAESGQAAPGHIRAYNIHTGKRVWIFHTIPQPGEPGYTSWKDTNAWKYIGGANSWAGMTLDEKRGILYVPTGSATFDFYGGLRKGQNLFANCILALKAATGELVWYYQTVHHDLWDRDLPAPPNLVTIKRNGKNIEAVAQVTKTGFTFVLDRHNGKPLYPIHEDSVPIYPALPGEEPWPTQPIPKLPEPFGRHVFTEAEINPFVPDSSRDIVKEQLANIGKGNIFLPPTEKGTLIFPGFDGGAEWGGASYDPQTGFLYVNANQIPWILTMVKAKSKENPSTETVASHGRIVYQNQCMTCHGKDRQGNGSYPSLQHIAAKYQKADILQLINSGRRMMPAFKQLPDDDKESLVTYLLGLKKGNALFIPSKEASKKTNLHPNDPYTMTGYNKFRTPEGYPANTPPWGTLTALNLNTGKRVWEIPLGEYPALKGKGIPTTGTENYGGAVITAGGLLFIAATPDKTIKAYNKRSGKLLWEASLPAAGFATPITYQIDGKQYIVIACGGGKLGSPSGDAYAAFALP